MGLCCLTARAQSQHLVAWAFLPALNNLQTNSSFLCTIHLPSDGEKRCVPEWCAVASCLPNSFEMLWRAANLQRVPMRGLSPVLTKPHRTGCACQHRNAQLGKGKKKISVSVVTTVLAAAWCGYNPRVELLCKMHAARRRQIIWIRKPPETFSALLTPVNSPAALPPVPRPAVGARGCRLHQRVLCSPGLACPLRWERAGFGGAVPAYGADSLVPRGIEDPWKAAGQVVGNADLVFRSSAEPLQMSAGQTFACIPQQRY